MQVADPGLLKSYMQLLTEQEQAYVNEGSSEAVQKERLLARTLQRTTLARYLVQHTNNYPICVGCAISVHPTVSLDLKPATGHTCCASHSIAQRSACLLQQVSDTICMVSRYCSGHSGPPSLRFERNRHGKPRLSYEEAEEQPDPPLHFSLTHTSTMLGKAACLQAHEFTLCCVAEGIRQLHMGNFTRAHAACNAAQGLCQHSKTGSLS